MIFLKFLVQRFGPKCAEVLTLNVIHCPTLNRINWSQHKSDNNNRIIQLADVCLLYC